MSKTVSNIITASKTVAVVSTALLTQEVVGLNDDHQPHHHRLRALQEGDVSSLSMRTTVISDDAENNKNNAIESKVAVMDEEEEKFQEKKQPSEILTDIGILVATIVKNGVTGEDLVDSLSQIDMNMDELRDDLTDIMKHLIGGPDAMSASSPSYMSDELVEQHVGKSGKMGKSEGGKAGKSEASYTCTPGADQCCPDDSEPPIGPFELEDVARGDECCEAADCFKYDGVESGVGCVENTCGCEFAGTNGGAGLYYCCETVSDCSSSITCGEIEVVVCGQSFLIDSTPTDKACQCDSEN